MLVFYIVFFQVFFFKLPDVSMKIIRILKTVANVSIPQIIGMSFRIDDVGVGVSTGFLVG